MAYQRMIANPSRVFRLRIAGFVGLLLLAVAGSALLAVLSERAADRTIGRLADVELESALLARQFRTAVDELHSALLRVGRDPAADSASAIDQRRQRLSRWLTERNDMERSVQVHRVLAELGVELRSYFRSLDWVAARPGGFETPLERAELASFDDMAVRLQSLADDFDAVHDAQERTLLEDSLIAVRILRNLVFGCVGLLVIGIAVLSVLLYRGVVRPLRAQLVARDELLARREKLAALGTLAAGVAHEIRNPLTAIKARLYVLRRADASSETQADLQAVAGELDRLEAIVRDVLGYARPADPVLAQVDLCEWIREFGAFVEPELTAAGVQLDLVTKAPVAALVDTNQLRQAVLNLVRNAREAFGGKPGRIVLSATREISTLRGRSAAVAVVSVIDDGPGIPREIQPRLFDPFFTTKRAGTGLGLSIVARLVEAHGGEIVFQTAPNAGTRFSLRLPAAGRVADTAAR